MSFHIEELHLETTYGLPSLSRRWKVVAASVAASVLLGMFAVLMKPVSYTASTQLLIYLREIQPGPDLIVSPGRADLTQVENEIEIIRARGTLSKVVQSLNLTQDREFVPGMTLLQRSVQWITGSLQASLDESRRMQEVAVDSLARHITVKRVGTSHTILVNVTTSDPKKSERIANGISQVMLQARVSAEQDGNRSPLQRERLQGLGPSAYVMTPALAPEKPNGPRNILIILGAVVAGLGIGSVLAVFLDFTDKTIRCSAQVEHFGVDCIGAIPVLDDKRAALAGRFHSGKPAGQKEFLPDALLNQTLLRAAVAIESARVRIVGIASSIAGEGASTVASHLARMATCSRKKVLFVETGRGGTPHFFSVSGSPTTAGRVDMQELSAGAIGNLAPPAAYHGDQARNWTAYCAPEFLADYDLIVVNLPPLERGAEFRMATQNLDGVLLVVKWGSTHIEQIERAFTVSRAVPSDFIGAVLNMVDRRMIGQFGDKLWEAEAALVYRRRSFSRGKPIEAS